MRYMRRRSQKTPMSRHELTSYQEAPVSVMSSENEVMGFWRPWKRDQPPLSTASTTDSHGPGEFRDRGRRRPACCSRAQRDLVWGRARSVSRVASGGVSTPAACAQSGS
jgi:hypothetical protein